MKKLNIIHIIQNLLPPTKRQPVMVAFLKVLTAPLQALNNWIADVYYADVTRRTKWNAQVLLFSKLLNDLYNGSSYNNRIYIDGGIADLEPTFLYTNTENITLGMYNQSENLPLYVYGEAEYEPLHDFVVHYPDTLQAKQPQIESTVKKYKLVGTTYKMASYAPVV